MRAVLILALAKVTILAPYLLLRIAPGVALREVLRDRHSEKKAFIKYVFYDKTIFINKFASLIT